MTMANHRDDVDFDPGFDRPKKRKTRRMSTATIIGLSIGSVVLCLIVCCAGSAYWIYHQSTPTWHDYASPGNDYQAQFPQKASALTTTTKIGPDGKSYSVVSTRYGFPPSSFSIRETLLSPQDARQAPILLKSTADAFAREHTSYREISRDPDTIDDRPSLELVLQHKDSTIVHRFVIAKQKLIIMTVESDVYDPDDDVMTEFLESLTFTGP
jgi:hypothetical protein